MQRGKTPYYSLGHRLSEIRKKALETVIEVSGAVEVDSDEIVRFEKGEDRPSEDVLMLLISHFDIQEDEADELWDLAGYTASNAIPMQHNTIPTLVIMPNDTRVMYSDKANVSINNYGVVLNFMQNSTNNQPLSIARIGMSMEHAKSVLDILARTIAKAESGKAPKQLPSTTKTKKNSR